MVIAALILTGAAALLHVFIFYMESIAWTSEKARATFGMTEEEALATKGMAFNQGFYNLFLAIAIFIGIVLIATGSTASGATLIFTGAGSMALAALVLFLSAPDKRGAAIKQGIFPLLGVIALVIGLLA